MLRLAVVDAGQLWPDYAEALRRVDAVKIGVVVDGDEDAARQLLVSCGGDSFARSIHELDPLRQDAIDAAVVHSPLESRADTACALAAMGKHILVDAPVATTLADLDRIAQVCHSSNVHIMVRQPLRNSPALQGLRRALDSGNLGLPGLVRLHHWDPTANLPVASKLAERVWELCYREVDLACWLFDGQPESVYATCLGEAAAGVELGIQLHLGFAGGGMALVDCLQSPRRGEDAYFMLTLIGSTGAAYVDDHRNTNLLIQERATSLKIDSTNDVTLQLQEFAHSVSSDPSTSFADDGRRVMAVIDAILESIDSGQARPVG